MKKNKAKIDEYSKKKQEKTKFGRTGVRPEMAEL